MSKDLNIYDNLAGLERYLNLPIDSLRNIPIYARKPAVDAIMKVKAMEASSLFRPGLYYIVLADLCGNTAFNAKYGNAEGDIRTQWFHTSAIQSLGEIDVKNYATFIKTIGDANLFIFSSFTDVINWSSRFSFNLDSMSGEYEENMDDRGIEFDEANLEEILEDFRMKARRLVHLGEVRYADETDPLSLAVSQTFKVEKSFQRTDLGITQAVADAVRPVLRGLNLKLEENQTVSIAGVEIDTMTYYVVPSCG